jgi:hypothetical protein
VTDAPDDSDRLKLCPFCRGSASLQIISEGPNVGGHYISCDKCGASTNIVFACGDDPIPLLMEMWNKRDETANHESHFRIKELEAQVEALRRALHEVAEEWAGSECGVPVHAQEAYAIGLAKRMYELAVEAMKGQS